jgi:hypothetical protein
MMNRSERKVERRHRRERRRAAPRFEKGIALKISIVSSFFFALINVSLSSLDPDYNLFVDPAFAGSHRDRGRHGNFGQDDQGQDLGHSNSESHGDSNDDNSGRSSTTDSHSGSDDSPSGGPQSDGAGSGDHHGRPENSSDGAKGNGQRQPGDDQARPPKTVEQMLKRMFAGNSTSSKHGVDIPPPATLPAVNLPVVLALNASSSAIERAKALGFKAVPPTTLANLAFSVTLLAPPEGVSVQAAEQLLHENLPTESFGINQKYRIYRTATGTTESPKTSQPAQMAGQTGCGSDHCFGRELIGWKPELGHCAEGMRIGVIDTSIDAQHPTFSRKKFEIGHFSASTKGPDWHGTGVTALLAGDPASGTPGLIPEADFVIADIFHADGDGQPSSDTISMLRALDWLGSKDVKIINMSLSGPYDDLVRQAIYKLSASGVLFVAAAGNDGPNAGPSYPAAYDNVIAVTAVSKNLKGYRYANRGRYIDIAAPGVSIWTALPGSMEGYHSGTSFSAPYVTAALAAIYSQQSGSSKFQILKQLAFKDLGAPGRDPVYGEGLLIAPTSCGRAQIAGSAHGPAATITGGVTAAGAPGAAQRSSLSSATDN